MSLAPLTREPKSRESRLGGSPSLPAPSCDFCGTSLVRGERRRLVWRSQPGTELILADLCRHCVTEAERLVDQHGGHGRAAIALVDEGWSPARPHRLFATIARGALYLLIALTFFLIVTVLSSLTR